MVRKATLKRLLATPFNWLRSRRHGRPTKPAFDFVVIDAKIVELNERTQHLEKGIAEALGIPELTKLDDAMQLVTEAYNRGEIMIDRVVNGVVTNEHAAYGSRITMKHKRMEPE